MLIVQKYGGSSLATLERVQHVARRIAATRRQGHRLVVVVSARGDTTDELLQQARALSPRPPARELDMLLATGEQQSVALVAMAVDALGVSVVSLTGWQAGIGTDMAYQKARITSVDTRRLERELQAGRVVIVAGFQGVSPDGDVTTLGRGGSDLTAVALAAALGADVCEIYSDVPGVFTADPRLVPEARKLRRIDYDEMLELASLGAQVLQRRSVEYARHAGVVIHARSTFSEEEGTLIEEVPAVEKRQHPVTGLALDRKTNRLALVAVPDRPGVAHRLFAALAEAGVDVDMIIQSLSHDGTNDIAFTVSDEDVATAEEVSRRVAAELGARGTFVDRNVAKVSAVGAGMAGHPGVAARMFGALAEANINIQMISTSEIKISCLVQKDEGERALRALHKAFQLEELGVPAEISPTA